MKITTRLEFGVIGAAFAFLAGSASAVVDQQIAIQGTNLVLSWPAPNLSAQYMIQFRPTLDADSIWVQLTNAVPANATPRTTYVIPCCTLDAIGWTGGGSGGTGELPPFPNSSMSFDLEAEPVNPLLGLWAMPSDGSGDPVPFAIYPPGADTSHLLVFEPPAELLTELAPDALAFDGGEMLMNDEGGTPLGISSGGCDCPGMGFFRIYHVPTFPSSIATYTFDGATFVPVDFADYLTLDMVDNVEVLLDGQQLHTSPT